MDPIILAAKRNFIENRKKRKSKNTELIGTSTGILSIYVTPKMIPRALKFMDTLINELKSHGYQINHKEFYGTIVVIMGIEFPIRLREKCRRINKGDELWRTTELEPIGKLVFTVDTFPRREWEDSNNKALDLKIPNIINYLEQKAKEEITYEFARKQRDKELEIQRQKEAETRQEREQEEQKFNALLEASERWHQAKKLCVYIQAVENEAKSNGTFNLELSNWLDWAKEKVDEMDAFRLKIIF